VAGCYQSGNVVKAAAIIHEARRRGYSPDQAIAMISIGLQESSLRHRAISRNSLWES
jgi:pentatricopeptide repeat protein